jgi:hypothetical protein
MLRIAVLALLLPAALSGQTLTSNQRWHDYLIGTVGPLAFVEPLVLASYGQVTGFPKWWAKDAGGFGQRFGTRVAGHTAATTADAGVAALLGQNERYHPCACQNAFVRTGYAIATTITPGRVVGASADGLTTMALYQHGYGLDGAVRVATISLVFNAAQNLVREFVGR